MKIEKSIQLKIEKPKQLKIEKPQLLNIDALAYIGDGVYELFVREQVLMSGLQKATNLHRESTKYVNAQAQADAIRGMFDELTEEEQRLVKRARNHKYNSKAKNADPITYKWATAFEALVGYLYLSDDEKRLSVVMEKAITWQTDLRKKEK